MAARPSRSTAFMFILLTIAMLAAWSPISAWAQREGGAGPGGGDSCEKRFDDVKGDILKWINDGGPKGLKFKPGHSERSYVERMKEAIRIAQVTCLDRDDEGYDIFVNGKPKECINFIDSEGVGRIRCDRTKFYKGLPDRDNNPTQYTMVHHELASLAELEIPDRKLREKSDYFYSGQIEAYLENRLVKRLAIRPQAQGTPLKLVRIKQLPPALKHTPGLCTDVLNTIEGFDEKGDRRLVLTESKCRGQIWPAFEMTVFSSSRVPYKSEGIGLPDHTMAALGQNPDPNDRSLEAARKRIGPVGVALQGLYLRLKQSQCRVVVISAQGALLNDDVCPF